MKVAFKELASYPTFPSAVIQMRAPFVLRSVLNDSVRLVSCVNKADCLRAVVASVPLSSDQSDLALPPRSFPMTSR